MEAKVDQVLDDIDLQEFRKTYKDLPARLGKWIGERPLAGRFTENQARWQISQKIKDSYYSIIDDQEITYPRGQVLKDTEDARERVTNLLKDKEEREISFERRDSVTGEVYYLRILRDAAEGLAIEEVKDSMVISKSLIRKDGSTELTLNYHGSRFDSKSNPEILAENLFPQASVEVFNLLAGTIK